MRVLKFGGTSVANAERFLRVAEILESNARQGQVATVLSAPAKITNHLVATDDGGVDAVRTLAQQGDPMQNVFDLRELLLNLLLQPGKGETGLNLGQACKQVGKNMLCVADVGYGILATDGLLNHRHQMVGNFGRGRQHGCKARPV